MPRPITPAIAVDIIIELAKGHRIVLIERRFEPKGWAIPGGFVDVGETLEHAAVREAREETGLSVRLKCLLGCYSSPDRDPRGHTVSAVYVAEAEGEPLAQDDAKALQICDPQAPPKPLAFDHELILGDYLHYRETGQMAPLRP